MIRQGVLFSAWAEVGFQAAPGLPWKKAPLPRSALNDPYNLCCYYKLAHAGDRGFEAAEGAGWVAWSRYIHPPEGKTGDLFTFCESGAHACSEPVSP